MPAATMPPRTGNASNTVTAYPGCARIGAREKGEANPELGYELKKRITQILIQRLQVTRLQLLDV